MNQKKIKNKSSPLPQSTARLSLSFFPEKLSQSAPGKKHHPFYVEHRGFNLQVPYVNCFLTIAEPPSACRVSLPACYRLESSGWNEQSRNCYSHPHARRNASLYPKAGSKASREMPLQGICPE